MDIGGNLKNVSDKKYRLLGQAIVNALSLKADSNGLYSFHDQKISLLGLGSSIQITWEATIKHTEEELEKLL
ncbi:MAG: hypothetical protein ACKVIO_00105 [Phycisphaerales bacterium]|jgi:hypothetical protein|tara:strand:- start:367 stop:582 length:216 start_codon:yes stop_codon:yes gene_type:complete